MGRLYVIVLYLALQTLDVVTTFVGLRRGAMEANFVPRWFLDNLGEATMYAFKVALVLGVLLVVLRVQSQFPHVWLAIRVVNVLMMLVVAINLLAIV